MGKMQKLVRLRLNFRGEVGKESRPEKNNAEKVNTLGRMQQAAAPKQYTLREPPQPRGWSGKMFIQ
jgi:hypothetical protein